MFKLTISSVVTLVVLFNPCVKANIIKNSNAKLQKSRNGEWLDTAEKIWLNWTVNEVTKTITFELEAETLGWVGFGISPQGGMTGADIFIAGVLPNGDHYSSDRHATGTVEPIVDAHSDWELHDARESGNRTYLKFSRLIDTCDDQDYPIGMDMTRLIWAFGITDEIAYHTSTRRGTKSVNLRGALIPEVDFTKLKEHKMVLDMVMPPSDTSYWCSFHKGPALDKKHHIVAVSLNYN
ncbi:DBH-like monooxygenase protein 2 homolog [Folsomia candida]|uniref:DBH-like monooxygenase protein 2 homolog n=1 Tax=Folsomia candida TaxID=158441 RepID=UPI00160556E3|nr:DBH-like monooxygenase protein 2 homolog [Folsomia candida]